MALQIVKIEPSPRKTKRFRAFINNGKYIDFGQQGSTTYIDGASEEKRYAYHARHYANAKERERIDNLTLSPALLSIYLLWSYSTDINKNLEYLNQELAKKY
jgi:hypothetical protein